MPSLSGVSIHPGIFIGTAKIWIRPIQTVSVRKIKPEQVPQEIEALQEALNQIESSLNNILDSAGLNETEKDILHTHLMILRDPELEKDLLNSIEEEHYSAATSVSQVFGGICRQFKEMQNDYFADRVADYKDVAQQILDELSGADQIPEADWDPAQVAVLEDISPSQVSVLAKSGVKAYLSQAGSTNSHASILSRALGLISIVSVPKLMESVSNGMQLVVDATSGVVILAPSTEELRHYRDLITQDKLKQHEDTVLTQLPAITASGVRIKLHANIELPEELDFIIRQNTDGIGLFRTEFLYLERRDLPSEDEQTGIYQKIVQSLAPRTVTIRSFDLGGDKLAHLIPSASEENPYLGKRGIRFSLSEPGIFRTQLRALLRASSSGNMQIMFPMIIDAGDFLQGKKLVLEVMKELDGEGIAYDKKIKLGAMIEIPSAALCASELAKVCDFFSIGTNDLVQYTLATDRNNDSVSGYYVQHHPAVLSLISMTIKAAGDACIPLSVCGEMASDPIYAALLIGLGIRELSVNPHQVLAVRKLIRSLDHTLLFELQSFNPQTGLAAVEAVLERIAAHLQDVK